MAMRSGTPARIMLRTADRRRSWTRRPALPAAVHAARHGLRKSPRGRPWRWNTSGQSRVRWCARASSSARSAPRRITTRGRLFLLWAARSRITPARRSTSAQVSVAISLRRQPVSSPSQRSLGLPRRDDGRRLRTAGTPTFVGPAAERVTYDDLASLYMNDYRLNRRRSLRDATRNVAQLRTTFGALRALEILQFSSTSWQRSAWSAGTSPGRGPKRAALACHPGERTAADACCGTPSEGSARPAGPPPRWR